MKYLSCQQCREADRIAIEELGVPSLTLMENAGRGCADAILKLNAPSEVLILCGRGNNGGDGFVIARHLHQNGKSVRVILLGKSNTVSSDANTNLERLNSARLNSINLSVIELPIDSDIQQIKDLLTDHDRNPPGVIVDAMLGTGASGGLRAPFEQVVKACNAMQATRIAVDLPSGLDGDTGRVANDAFRADLTFTFIAAKQGMNTDNGRHYCGEVRLVDIGLPQDAIAQALQ